MSLGMSQSQADALGDRGTDEGGKMKTKGTIEEGDGLWYEPNTGATNESGFSALPGGYRHGNYGYFGGLGYNAIFWSSAEYTSRYAWYRILYYLDSDVYRYGYDGRRGGYSVRCVRDN